VPTGSRNCSNLKCGTTGLSTETCPRCGAPTFRASQPGVAVPVESEEAARKRRESIEALSPEMLAQLRAIKEEARTGETVPRRTVTIVAALVIATLVVLAIGLVLANNRSDSGDDRAEVASAVESLFRSYSVGDAAGVCSRLSPEASQTLQSQSGATTCEQVVQNRTAQVAQGTPTVVSVTDDDVSVDGDSATAVLQVGNANFTVPVARRDGDWLVSDAGAVDQVFATLDQNSAAAAAPPAAVPPPAGATGAPGTTGPTATTGATGPTAPGGATGEGATQP
jgi:hypothetical protein